MAPILGRLRCLTEDCGFGVDPGSSSTILKIPNASTNDPTHLWAQGTYYLHSNCTYQAVVVRITLLQQPIPA